MDQISNQIINSHLSLSSCRRFFLPYSGETSSNKSDAISAVLNHGMGLEGTFQKRMYINIPSAMLTSLLGELVDEVQIPDDNQRIKRAVQIVGRNEGWEKEPVWVLNKSLAISRYGCQIDPAAHGLVWIGHRVQGDNVNVASQEEECVVATPLSTVSWDAMLNFMAGTLPWRMFSFIARVFSTLPAELAIEPSVDEPSEEKDPSFLSAFFLASQSVTIANYEEVRVVAVFVFCQMLTLITIAPPRYQKCLKANFIFSRTENYLLA